MDISTQCEICKEFLDGPCYEHAAAKRIIFDKSPVPLAYSSLPVAFLITNVPPDQNGGKAVVAKNRIKAWTLFGPLIAPLVTLDQLQDDPPQYVSWSEDTDEIQAYDLSDDFLCNWIKFIRPCTRMQDANVIAYQQRGSIYFVVLRDILSPTELRVYVKRPRKSAIREYYNLPAVAQSDDLLFTTTVKVGCREYQGTVPRIPRGKSVPKAKLEEASVVEPEVNVEDSYDELDSIYEVDTHDFLPPADMPVSVKTRRRKATESVQLPFYNEPEFSSDGEADGARVEFNVPVPAYHVAVNRTQKHTNSDTWPAKEKSGWESSVGHRVEFNVPAKDISKPAGFNTKSMIHKGSHSRSDHDRRKRIRQKVIEGIPLTPEEQLHRERGLAVGRAHKMKKGKRLGLLKAEIEDYRVEDISGMDPFADAEMSDLLLSYGIVPDQVAQPYREGMSISTRCMECQEDLDGPCYKHTDVKRIIFDKPPVPLAYSSLPDTLKITNISSVPGYYGEKAVVAKGTIKAWTLFGPLIAPLLTPLLPLDEVQNDAVQYYLWSEEAQESQSYDLSDDFLCNWIKYVRPCTRVKEANVVAYQQDGTIYFVVLRDILPSTELRVYIKRPRSTPIRRYYDLPAVAQCTGFQFPTSVKVGCRKYEESPAPVKRARREQVIAVRWFKKPSDSVVEPEVKVDSTENDRDAMNPTASRDIVPSTELPVPITGTDTKIEYNVPAAKLSRKFIKVKIPPVRERIVKPKEYKAKPIAPVKPIQWSGEAKMAKPTGVASRSRKEEIRQKVIAGLPLTPEEEMRRAGNKLPTFRVKMRQGLPLTSEEEAAYQIYLTKNRADNRKYYKRRSLAKGVEPKEMPERRKAPFEKGKSSTGESERKSKDNSSSEDSEESSDGSGSQEA